jgi:hypothetical protein
MGSPLSLKVYEWNEVTYIDELKRNSSKYIVTEKHADPTGKETLVVNNMLDTGPDSRHFDFFELMMMTFICSCRNNNQPNAIYPLGTFHRGLKKAKVIMLTSCPLWYYADPLSPFG